MSGGISKLFLVTLFAVPFFLRASAALSAEEGMLYVKSDPLGATVFIDGEERGTTPTFIRNVRPGHRVVQLRLPGKPVRTEVVTVEAGKIAKLKVVISAAPAALTVISDPLEATVLLDGQDRGKTPFTIERVEPGPHEVVVRRQGYQPVLRNVELAPGQNRVLEVSLRPDSARGDGAVARTEPGLARILGEFEALIGKADYVGARRLAERSAQTAGAADDIRAAARVARALEERREAIHRGARALVGEEVTLRTKAGPCRGEVREVGEEGIALSTRIRAGGRLVGETRFSVAWNDLAPEQEELLAKGWDEEVPDGRIALAFLALARGDLAAAGKAVHEAGGAPLAGYVRGRIEQVKRAPAETAAREAWAEIEHLAGEDDLSAAQAGKLLAKLGSFERRHGRTEHAAAVSETISRLREAARLARLRAAGAPPDAVGFGGHWYKLFEESTTWREAKRLCEERGGHLVTVTSEEESEFVTDLVRAAGVDAWIGLTDERREGRWEWVTGEEVTFTAWSPGEPNNAGGAQHYGRIWRGAGYRWDDEKDGGQTGPTPFICEWDLARRRR